MRVSLLLRIAAFFVAISCRRTIDVPQENSSITVNSNINMNVASNGAGASESSITIDGVTTTVSYRLASSSFAISNGDMHITVYHRERIFLSTCAADAEQVEVSRSDGRHCRVHGTMQNEHTCRIEIQVPD